MPIFERECKSCGFFREQIEKVTASKTIQCPECGKKKLKKVMSKTNFKIVGGKAANGYYTPPTNEELGLEPENVLLRRLESDYAQEELQLNRDLTPQEKEHVQDDRKYESSNNNTHKKYIEGLQDKHKEFSGKVDESMKKAKNRPDWYRKQSMEKKIKSGDMGVKKLKGSKVEYDVES